MKSSVFRLNDMEDSKSFNKMNTSLLADRNSKLLTCDLSKKPYETLVTENKALQEKLAQLEDVIFYFQKFKINFFSKLTT